MQREKQQARWAIREERCEREEVQMKMDLEGAAREERMHW